MKITRKKSSKDTLEKNGSVPNLLSFLLLQKICAYAYINTRMLDDTKFETIRKEIKTLFDSIEDKKAYSKKILFKDPLILFEPIRVSSSIYYIYPILFKNQTNRYLRFYLRKEYLDYTSEEIIELLWSGNNILGEISENDNNWKIKIYSKDKLEHNQKLSLLISIIQKINTHICF